MISQEKKSVNTLTPGGCSLSEGAERRTSCTRGANTGGSVFTPKALTVESMPPTHTTAFINPTNEKKIAAASAIS